SSKYLSWIKQSCQAGSEPRSRNHAFSLQSPSILQAETVRAGLFTFAFLALATASYAQEQERKLVDRLLSPDTKLSNSDQNKKFTGGTEAPTTRSASTKTFYVSDKKLTKTFVADRQ